MDDEEIQRWLAATADPSADIASRAYSHARLSHVGGERPKWIRGQWHNLPSDYREFLVSIARLAMSQPPPPQDKTP
jgi:hypothetical protein